jgi:hypothetical protein
VRGHAVTVGHRVVRRPRRHFATGSSSLLPTGKSDQQIRSRLTSVARAHHGSPGQAGMRPGGVGSPELTGRAGIRRREHRSRHSWSPQPSPIRAHSAPPTNSGSRRAWAGPVVPQSRPYPALSTPPRRRRNQARIGDLGLLVAESAAGRASDRGPPPETESHS